MARDNFLLSDHRAILVPCGSYEPVSDTISRLRHLVSSNPRLA
jgi:hypothetical protein